MTRFEGRSSLKQYLTMLPIKRRYKVWCRADSQAQFLNEFQVYESKGTDPPASVDLGEHVVLLIIDEVDTGTQLHFHNFFTSTHLKEAFERKEHFGRRGGSYKPQRFT
ncbi:hypothetical protein HPB48_010647 [Haemaphysalis longicornis]|uniref:PiggyBac transposable element-derived protein domain-containing protein n=1 Tax=Haemaphysalis longicornis TaxID=44386 RepID=A0A9J6G1B9_HAELO|nr:hypothetical protein HPB48_010647 [Haemaphysalis longicornis]